MCHNDISEEVIELSKNIPHHIKHSSNPWDELPEKQQFIFSNF